MNLDPEQARAAATVSASLERDGERWWDSYTQHTATSLRRRALAAGNGHAAGEATHPTREPGS